MSPVGRRDARCGLRSAEVVEGGVEDADVLEMSRRGRLERRAAGGADELEVQSAGEVISGLGLTLASAFSFRSFWT